MKNYRIYLSIRLADTSVQVADITIQHCNNAAQAEIYVEKLNSGESLVRGVHAFIEELGFLHRGAPLLRIYMKELIRPVIPLVRYCPECGHVGEVPETTIGCCPDSHPADVPETFVQVTQRAQVVIEGMFEELTTALRCVTDEYEGHIVSEYEGCKSLPDKLKALEPARNLLARFGK